jgi:predicted ThiF/HesA family dinucleotide-utilizing enzyme
LNFEQGYTRAIEAALDRERLGMWNRQFSAIPNLSIYERSVSPVAAWRILTGKRYQGRHNISEMFLLVDLNFPYSEPRVVVPGLQLGDWPHVEPGGLLCLKETLVGACPGERILQAISYADDLLMFDAERVDSDFRLEFSSYWSQKETRESKVFMYSLASVTRASKVVVYAKSLSGKTYYFADTKKQLQRWLENRRNDVSGYSFGETKLQWLPQPLIPSKFPETGNSALSLFDETTHIIKPAYGGSLPLLLGATTSSGDVVVGMVLKPSVMAMSTKGFRKKSACWNRRLKDSLMSERIGRYSVDRVDGEYVHSRGADGEYSNIKNKRVAIIGCGSLGSSICMLLAQAGVGRFLLVDNDRLQPHNTSRHALGSRFIGRDKVDGMKAKIQEDFPHIEVDKLICERVEKVSDAELEEILSCDLVVTCGIDFIGVKHVMKSRCKLRTAPCLVCWAEPFSLSGHSFGILAGDDIDMAVGENCRSSVEIVDWGAVDVMVAEAGCGNYFQPHGAIDLQRVAIMSARHALDILQSFSVRSEHRCWIGDKQVIEKRGGRLVVDPLRVSNSEWTEPWPPTQS